MDQEEIRERAATIAEIFRSNQGSQDKDMLFTDLIESEMYSNALTFEESLEVVSLAVEMIKEQPVRSKVEKMEAVKNRSHEYVSEVYLPDSFMIHNGYVVSLLADVCSSEGVVLEEYIEFIKKDKKEGKESGP